ncbi:UNKNOWN [Stylonychia lemnae]|uniref:Uncharacterized protein n=1 Tax=Stylonychia lemnae TaxID=5949 RepID=A0A078A387_STYLE|nr:UNKNOWN [Stylonychia lemnae]|eukprot:CDW76632.1 UNKNOWN [Stylonychia lemnae]
MDSTLNLTISSEISNPKEEEKVSQTATYYRPNASMKLLNVGENLLEPGFTELWFKKESFTIVPDNKDLPVEYEDILSVPSSQKGELTSILALSMESYTKFDNTKVASRKEREFWTHSSKLMVIISISFQQDSMIVVKSGLRTQIKNLAKAKGPSTDKVRQKVLELIKGRRVIGYHIYLKLNDFGIWSDMLCEEYERFGKPIDCSVMFNHTEAKICMALFKKWQVRQEQAALLRESRLNEQEFGYPLREISLNVDQEVPLRVQHCSQKNSIQTANMDFNFYSDSCSETVKLNKEEISKDVQEKNVSCENHLAQIQSKDRTLQSVNHLVIDSQDQPNGHSAENSGAVIVTGAQLKSLIRDQVDEYLRLKLKSLLEKVSL